MKRFTLAAMTALTLGGALLGAGTGVAAAAPAGGYVSDPEPAYLQPQAWTDPVEKRAEMNNCGFVTGFGPGGDAYRWCDNQGNFIGQNTEIPNQADVMFW